MPKLREILTQEEHSMVSDLRVKMRNSESIKESDYYRSEIEMIFEQAKERYFASINHQPQVENVHEKKTLKLRFRPKKHQAVQ